MDPFIGEIRMFAGNFAPANWAFCNGQLLSISSNAALYSLLGTLYGGNGTTTFGLPNMQSRVPIHAGQGTGLSVYTLGQMSGSESVTLTTQQMPTHNHTHVVNGTASSATSSNPASAYLANSGNKTGAGGSTIAASSADGSTMAPQSIGMTGGSQPHSNLQPYLCVNFIIALVGIYPSRG